MLLQLARPRWAAFLMGPSATRRVRRATCDARLVGEVFTADSYVVVVVVVDGIVVVVVLVEVVVDGIVVVVDIVVVVGIVVVVEVLVVVLGVVVVLGIVVDVVVVDVFMRRIMNGSLDGLVLSFPMMILSAGLVLPSDWNAKSIDGAQCV